MSASIESAYLFCYQLCGRHRKVFLKNSSSQISKLQRNVTYNVSKILEKSFFLDFHIKVKPIQFDQFNPFFSAPGLEKFTLKAGSKFLSEAFQFIIAEKCNIQIARIFAYAIAQMLRNRALVTMSQR